MFYIGREEFLTEAARFWNFRKIECLPKTLAQRLKKVLKYDTHIYVLYFIKIIKYAFKY